MGFSAMLAEPAGRQVHLIDISMPSVDLHCNINWSLLEPFILGLALQIAIGMVQSITTKSEGWVPELQDQLPQN